MATFSIAALLTPGTATGNYDITQAWVPLPPGITSLPAAPAPVSDPTYGEVLTPTALLRPYQESIRVDCVVKVQMTQRRLEYPLTLPERASVMKVKAFGTASQYVGNRDAAFAPKVKMPTIGHQTIKPTTLAPRAQYALITEWTPLDLTPSLWLDAADATSYTLSGSTVTQFDDKSGNGNYFEPMDGTPVRLTAAQNGLNTIYFDGADDRLKGVGIYDRGTWSILHTDEVTTDQAWTIIMAIKPIASGTNNGWTRDDIDFFVNDGVFWAGSRDSLAFATASGGTAGFCGLYYGPDALSFAWPFNTWGIAIMTNYPVTVQFNNNTPLTSSATTSTTTDTDFILGSLSTRYMEYELGEMIAVKRVINSGEKAAAISYLAEKWDITV